MKINKKQIKSLVKEIITTALEETVGDASWTLVDDDNVLIENFETPTGQIVDINVYIRGIWDDGAFDYEYGSIKGTHRYETQYEVDEHTIDEIKDNKTGQIIWQMTKETPSLKLFNPELDLAIEKYWDDIERKVEQYINENPPDQDFGGDED